MEAALIIIAIIIFIAIGIPALIAYFTPDDYFSCKNNEVDEANPKSNFRIELENNLSKYKNFIFERSKNKTYPIGLRNFDSIKFVDEKNLVIFNVYGDEYLDIEFNSIEDYSYEKNRMLKQYEEYQNALNELHKYYPPHPQEYEDDCDDYCCGV